MTSAEALNTELQRPYNQAMSDVYSSILGVPAVGVNRFTSSQNFTGFLINILTLTKTMTITRFSLRFMKISKFIRRRFTKFTLTKHRTS
jgi:hypothetical protein